MNKSQRVSHFLTNLCSEDNIMLVAAIWLVTPNSVEDREQKIQNKIIFELTFPVQTKYDAFNLVAVFIAIIYVCVSGFNLQMEI
jgi:hypothetical protein